MRPIATFSVLFSLLLILGCAGAMKKTEPGYMPTHVAVGEVYSFNISPGMKNEDLIRLFSNFVEEELYDQGARYIPMKELESTPVPHEATVLMNLEISFQSGRIGVDIMVVYTLRRRSDKMVWITGSVRASDMPNSESALYDRTTGLQFGAKSVVNTVKKALEVESSAD